MKIICNKPSKPRFPSFSLRQDDSNVYIEITLKEANAEINPDYIILFENELNFYFESGSFCLKLNFQSKLYHPEVSKQLLSNGFQIVFKKLNIKFISNLDLIMHEEMRSLLSILL